MTAVMNVLLFLLKWLGILLLVALGLVLLLILVVLLVPVRYKGSLDKKEEPEEVFRADGLVSWLNPFLRVRIRYTEKKLRYTVRIFGICLLNSDKSKKEKKRKDKPEKAKKKRKLRDKKPETAPEQGSSESKSADEGVAPENSAKTENVTEPEKLPDTEEATEAVEGSTATGSKKKKSVTAKIKGLFEKIKAIPGKIKEKVTHAINTVKLLWYKKEKVVLFLEDELHKTALGKAWTVVKQLLRHVLPGKIKGHVEFGTGSPESTGKALGVLGMLYAAYGKGVTVVPDFYEKRVVAELEFKGRIRLGTILVKVLRLIRDKNVKRFHKNFKKLLNIMKQKAE